MPLHLRNHQERLISLVLKVAKEQEFCYPSQKVMIFTCDDEGTDKETVKFKMIEVDDE